MSHPGLLVPVDSHDEVGLTDWFEAVMLSDQLEHLSKSRIRSYIREIFSEENAETSVEAVLAEVGRRKFLCSDAYPFSQDYAGVNFKKGMAGSAYLFMLCLSVSKAFRTQARFKETDELFDLLVLDALERYLGPGCEGMRFGSPASGGRPRNFRDGIAWLALKMNLPVGPGGARKTAGDGGMDVAVWRHFRDKRSGFLTLLAQCTVQVEWFEKSRDLNEDSWRGWLDFGKNPHLALAIPFVIPHPFNKWDELRRNVHSILDRLRLCELLGNVELRGALKTSRWTSAEVKRFGRSK
jgi:hypothetical protein